MNLKIKKGVIMSNSKINITTDELDEYMNIEFDGREYRVHYEIMFKQSELPCFKCGIKEDNTEFLLSEIGAIYDVSGYFQIDNTFEKYDDLLREIIRQIQKKKCFVVCADHNPDFNELEEEMQNEDND
ncbi:MAG: hypothetical protein V1865_02290 [bacterium]